MTFVRTYDAATAPRGMLRHVLPLLGYPKLIWRNRYMIHNFFRRELMGRFHGSYLGVGWLLARPLFQFAIYYFVFGILFGDLRGGKAPDTAHAIYLFSGVIFFYTLVEATSICCNVVVANGNLVKKVAFPSETLVIPVVLNALVVYAVGAVVCIATGLAFGVLQPGWLLLGFVPLGVVMLVFMVGFGLLLANANVFIRDVSQLWGLATMAWMFVTPVFWTPDLLYGKVKDGLGEQFTWIADLFFNLNPAYSMLQASRLSLGGVDPLLGDFWMHMLWSSCWAVAAMVLGYSSFMSAKHKYADLV
ncbi:MAG: ABC transporter permease [Planctomycetota bacterium]